MITCKQASELISQSMDTVLTKRKRLQLRFHLLFCDACCNFQRQVRWLSATVKRLARMKEADPDVKLSPEARARIQASLKDADNS
ncbi:MAG TPA: zf-HC2 domain-containing protein [Methylophilaceae bacterium]|nr:zf-HC2 domain-containing protein [Methylophilaceae bacterium]